MNTFNKEELDEIVKKGWIIHELSAGDLEYSGAFMSVYHTGKNMYYDPVKKWVKNMPTNRGIATIGRGGQAVLMGNLLYFDIGNRPKGSIYFFSMYLKDEAPFWEMKGFYTVENHLNPKKSKSACYTIKSGTPEVSTPEELVDFASWAHNDFAAQAQVVDKKQIVEMDGMMIDALLVATGDDTELRTLSVYEKENRLFEKLDGNLIRRKKHMVNIMEVFSQFLNTENNAIGMLMEAFSFAGWYSPLVDLVEEKSLTILKEDDVYQLELSEFLTHFHTGELDDVDLLTIEKMFSILLKKKSKKEIKTFAEKALRIKRDKNVAFSKGIHDMYSLEADREEKKKTASATK